MKLTKSQTRNHDKVMDLINSDKVLSYDEKIFVFENYQESANTNNSSLGAFFTPTGLARDFCHEVNNAETVIDLCAGIGMLGFMINHHYSPKNITCVELNAEYVKIGKRVLPEAHWINADALKVKFKKKFNVAVSNPPFGNIKTSNKKMKYTGSDFEFKIMEKCLDVAEYGILIVPQSSANFKYSGQRYFEEQKSRKVQKFLKETDYVMSPGMGIDTNFYINDWKGVKPLCEVVYIEKE